LRGAQKFQFQQELSVTKVDNPSISVLIFRNAPITVNGNLLAIRLKKSGKIIGEFQDSVISKGIHSP